MSRRSQCDSCVSMRSYISCCCFLLQSLTKDMGEKEEELRKVIHFGYKVQENPTLTKNLKDNIQKESATLKNEWDTLETAVEEKTKRYVLLVSFFLSETELESTALLNIVLPTPSLARKICC